ncbi:IS3 family transposase [Butyricicoccus porcorum]|uniref:Transposase n=1 Tax=Butyricicoccus porcorum TaxID=1945634 RepID=A0A252F3V1_9FIRM|nr:IS3 family transposase [Butyricicoccus porcorum]OUM20381.1 transposase [Butyricicoccus porcorum]
MYTKEQEEIALREYERLGSIAAVIRRLGYPSESTLYRWYERKKAGLENRHGHTEESPTEMDHHCNTSGHPRHPSAEFKYEVIHRCFELGEDVEYVSREIGYSRMSIYVWRRKYLKYGMVGLMAKRKSIPREPLPQDHALPESEELENLRTQLQELQFEVDVLKETISVLKKDPGIDLTVLRNREKAVIIDALKGKYALPALLSRFKMAKSSYYYQQAVMNKPDKYLSQRAQITSIFHENRGIYGYRRIYLALKRKGIMLSEKIIRRIMKEEKLVVLRSKKRNIVRIWGNHTEVENIILRDFHANQPYEKLLTDITEFALSNGKLYLSAMIDCFDGMVVGWTIGTRPNADLVNTMLDQVIADLPEGCHPIVHSDRGCHYRWPGWIERMNGAGLIRSMSKKGCSPDNAACEGFFGRLKNEMFYGRSWTGVSLDDFSREIDRYINWYNHKRIKLSLGGLSPIEYRHHLGFAA